MSGVGWLCHLGLQPFPFGLAPPFVSALLGLQPHYWRSTCGGTSSAVQSLMPQITHLTRTRTGPQARFYPNSLLGTGVCAPLTTTTFQMNERALSWHHQIPRAPPLTKGPTLQRSQKG